MEEEAALAMAKGGLNIVIIGAGIGGLAAAVSIKKEDPRHHVVILEAANEIKPVGAGIQINANATRILRYWGLEEELSRYAAEPEVANFRRYSDGRVIGSVDLREFRERYNSQFWNFHRANLHRVLLEAAVRHGAKLLTQKTVCDVEFDAGRVHCRDGSTYEADLIIGADGVNSSLRDKFSGHEDPPRLSGDLAFRLLVPGSVLKQSADKFRDLLYHPKVNYWVGPNAHLVCYPLRDGEYLNMVLLVPDTLGESDSKYGQSSTRELREYFKDFDPFVNEILAHVEDTAEMVTWRLAIRDKIPSWSRGKFVFLGDAVHASLPYLSQGAGMCIEDACVLGRVLADVRNPDQVAMSIKAYETARIGRTGRLVEAATHHQYYWHLPDGAEQAVRDAAIAKAVPDPGCPFLWKCPLMSDFIFGYDALMDADNTLAVYRAGVA